MKRFSFAIICFVLTLCIFSFLNCKKNGAPYIPEIFHFNPTKGTTNIEYTFCSVAYDLDDDNIAIRFDWGDGDTSDWSSYVLSWDAVIMSHSWSDSGTYFVRAQAKDIHGATSNWSNNHQIVILFVPGWFYGVSNSVDCGYSVQQTSDNGYIIAGLSSSLNADVYLIKTDNNGDTIWTKTYGENLNDEGYSVQQTSDGGYIIVGWSIPFLVVCGDVYLIKTDASGNHQWFKKFGGSGDDCGYSVQPTSDGGYIIAGGTKSFGAGWEDVYLIKIDGDGNQQWFKTFGDSLNDCGYSVQQTSDGGYIIVGGTRSYGVGECDVYLIKTDGNGDTIWTKTFGGGNDDYSRSVQQTSDGGYVIAGWTYTYGAGQSDVYLIKTDASGNQQWFRTFGGTYYDEGYSVNQTIDGGYIITGYTNSFGASDYDVYIIKTDNSGDTLWTKTYGGFSSDCGYSVQQTSDGGYIITGMTNSFGGSDVYLIKTDANGNAE